MNAVHYDEEQLIELFERGEQAVARDPHVRACRTCADTVTSIAQFSESLKSPDVWEGPELSPDPNPQVLATLRAAQQRMRTEDEQAEAQVKELLAGPRESWMPRLQEHPEWRTAGMVRKLIASTDRAIETMPPDALEIANLAVRIAEGLEGTGYQRDEVATLTSSSYREHAYAFYYIGRYHEAIADATRADLLLPEMAQHARARVALVRALALCELEEFDEALTIARSAARTFEGSHDGRRVIVARRTEGIVLYRSRRFKEALAVFSKLLSSYATELDGHSHPALLQNIAICMRELGELDEATKYFVASVRGFQALGILTLLYKAQWHLGRTLLAQGRFDDAVRVLEEVRNGFSGCAMANDVAMVTLDIANALIAVGRTKEIVDQCRCALEYFAAANLEQTSSAAMAVMFLREAAIAGEVDSRVLDEARHHFHVESRSASTRLLAPSAPPPDVSG